MTESVSSSSSHANSGPVVVRVAGVSFGYHESERVLDGVDLELGSGLVLLVGPNGCGKSTLLKLIAGVERPDRGRIEIGGFDLWRDEVAARRHLAYVPEQPDVTPYASVLEVLELVADLRHEPPGRAAEELAAIGLQGLGGRSIRELSKGQRRRVLLAAARLGRPPRRPSVFLLDEPLDALDRGSRADLLRWLGERLGDGALIVAVTHELEPLVPLATAAVALAGGRPEVLRDLPIEPSRRLEVLEPLARGEASI